MSEYHQRLSDFPVVLMNKYKNVVAGFNYLTITPDSERCQTYSTWIKLSDGLIQKNYLFDVLGCNKDEFLIGIGAESTESLTLDKTIIQEVLLHKQTDTPRKMGLIYCAYLGLESDD